MDIQFPLDADGFFRRECPSCEREFKWHHGKTSQAPEDFVYPDVYWCPLCGQAAAHDQWWTIPQLEYQQEIIAGYAYDEISDALKGSLRPRRGSMISIEVTTGERPATPDPLVEPDDMVMIAPPCHEWEPVKVPESSAAPYYCLVCGEPYAL